MKIFISITVVCIMILSIILVSCTEETTPTPTPSTLTEMTTATHNPTEATWWDEFGEPQYGGELTIRTTSINAGSFDPADTPVPGIMTAGGMACNLWGEGLCFLDWTLERSEWAFSSSFAPNEYFGSLLAQSWELTDQQTITIHIQQGVHWQNKEPVNGRELTASDIVYNFNRLLGTGSGYTEPNIFYAPQYSEIKDVTATDECTVEFTINQSATTAMTQLLSMWYIFIPPEWIELAESQPEYARDWTNVVGSSPWILTEFIDGSKMVYTKNPDYWGHDERYPENILPYADTCIQLAIADESTAMAAMRTGKIDMWTDPMGSIPWMLFESLTTTYPEVQMATQPRPSAVLYFKCDVEPFTEINVRKALNMAIDRSMIAETYYGGYSDGKPCGQIGPSLGKYAALYDDWTQELKDEYAYNVEGAKQLLADAGYPEGFTTNVVAASTMDLQLLEIIKSQFMDVGVDMKIEVMDLAGYQAFVAAGLQDQMVYNDAYAGLLGTPTVTLAYLTSAAIPQTNATFNYDNYFDSLYEKVKKATDSSEMQRLSAEADLYAIAKHWMLPVVPSNSQIVIWQPWIKGYSGEILWEGSWAGALRARLWVDSELKEYMRTE